MQTEPRPMPGRADRFRRRSGHERVGTRLTGRERPMNCTHCHGQMKPIQFILSIVSIFCIFVSVSSCESKKNYGVSLTKDAVKQRLASPPQNREILITGTYPGCVSVPATDWIQKTMVGFEFTGETCSLTVHPNNIVSLSFLGNKQIPVVSTSTSVIATDIFVGELGDDEALIVQHHQGRVVSATQTIYDKNNNLVYGLSGDGDSIKECLILLSKSCGE